MLVDRDGKSQQHSGDFSAGSCRFSVSGVTARGESHEYVAMKK